MDKKTLISALVGLYRRAACVLPDDVGSALDAALKDESGPAKDTLSVILKNSQMAKEGMLPICQDTGTPVFDVELPKEPLLSVAELIDAITAATKEATEKIPLRPNAVDPLTGKNSNDNTGAGVPIIHFNESADGKLRISLLLKGGGCENTGRLYSLPNVELDADRNLDGVRKCVLDAVQRAQGLGCPPSVVGVGIAGSRDEAISLAKKQLFRIIDDKSGSSALAGLESRLLSEINSLGIGPMGLGGKTTALAVKIGASHRHPATFFVDVSFSCWACRRAGLEVTADGISDT